MHSSCHILLFTPIYKAHPEYPPRQAFVDIFDESLYFSFLTVQQPVDNVTSPVTIDVSYEISGTPYSSSFSLDSVQGVGNWMAGTKTRYAIILDSEVRLLGSIVSWKDGGDMEGTLVP